MIALAIALNLSIVIADEPTTALDVIVQAKILDLLKNVQNTYSMAMIIITHDLVITKYISDRIAVMYLGKIVEMGEKEEIFSNPLHPYTQALLSAIPVPNPERKRRIIELKGEVPSAIRIPTGCRFHPRCPFAEEACQKEEPELTVAPDGHLVACHLINDNEHTASAAKHSKLV